LNADILGIIELENNSTEAIANLVDGVNQAAGSALYDYVDTGVLGTQDIRVGLIYQPGRVSPIGNFAVLDSTYDADFRDTYNRPALAQTFQDSFGERLTVVVNHLKSKGSSCAEIGDPDMNDGQGNCNLTRTQAVEVLTQWLASDPTNSGDADFLILGDLNAYAMENPVRVLKENGYTNLIDQYDVQPVYSYVFDGQSGVLDHAFASSSLVGKVRSADIWHINADEPRILDYNQEFNPVELYQPDAFRSSDHDPIVVTIMPAGATEVFFPLTTR
jgi:predicted extracellular nuclease